MSEKVNIAVCGKFHILKYIEFIESDINKLYFSSRYKNVKNLNFPREKLNNFMLKEYLIQIHGRLLGDKLYEVMNPFYHKIWQRGVLKKWESCDLLHFVSHGACLNVIDKAIKTKSKILCEVVNTHPEYRLKIIREQSQKWGIKFKGTNLLKREMNAIREAENSDYLLSPSECVTSSYREMGFSKKVFKLPYVSDTKAFTGKVRADIDRPLKIISVGRISLRKGQLYILEALKNMGNQVELTLVGSIQPEIAKLVRKYNFNHIERVPHNMMPHLYAKHDVYISASLEEGLSLSIGEALANGLVVLATRESGGQELIKDRENGFIIPSNSSKAIETLVISLLSSDYSIQSISGLAIDTALSTFNWKNYSSKLKQVYKDVLNDKA